MSKADVISLIDGEGFVAIRCKGNKKLALELINGELDDGEKITENDLKEEECYSCRLCGFYTLGERECVECGKGIGGKAMKVFVYYS